MATNFVDRLPAHKPERLIIFDIYENNAYDIQQELKMKYPNLKLTVLIGSIRDEERVDTVLGKYRPDIIYSCCTQTCATDGGKSE